MLVLDILMTQGEASSVLDSRGRKKQILNLP